MFEGSFVAIVTPFKNGKVDAKALKDLIEFHIEMEPTVLFLAEPQVNRRL